MRLRCARRNARTFILDGDADAFAALSRPSTANRLSFRPVLHGVVEQVQHDLAMASSSTAAIAPARASSRSSSAAAIGRNASTVSRTSAATSARPRSRSAACRARRARTAGRSRRAAQAPRLLVDDGQRAAPLLVRADAVEQQRLREHPDLRQRRAQLVRDAGHEVGAHARQRPLAPDLENGRHQEHGRDGQQHDVDRRLARPCRPRR